MLIALHQLLVLALHSLLDAHDLVFLITHLVSFGFDLGLSLLDFLVYFPSKA